MHYYQEKVENKILRLRLLRTTIMAIYYNLPPPGKLSASHATKKIQPFSGCARCVRHMYTEALGGPLKKLELRRPTIGGGTGRRGILVYRLQVGYVRTVYVRGGPNSSSTSIGLYLFFPAVGKGFNRIYVYYSSEGGDGPIMSPLRDEGCIPSRMQAVLFCRLPLPIVGRRRLLLSI